MNKYDLSIIIPARNEMFLKNTVEDILKNKQGKTEIIAVLDGVWSDPPLTQHPDVNIIYVPESIGQRASTNLGVKLSKAKWIMKLDAHCSMSEGFDVKLMTDTHNDWTIVPIMKNLWAFDWKCYHCGWKKYQGPTPTKCEQCGKTDKIRRKMIWMRKKRPNSTSYCFDSEPHFQYFNAYTKTDKYTKDLETGFTETMSLQGSCFMCTREKYLELNLCDENFGSWGNQGIEVAIKTWISGGQVIVDHNVDYAHMFRTQGGDFSFPYEQSGRAVAKCKSKVRDMFWNNKYDKAIYPLSWLIEKFWLVPGWTDEQLKQLKASEKQNN